MELVKKVAILCAVLEIARCVHVGGGTGNNFQLSFIGAQNESDFAVCSCNYLRKLHPYNKAQMCHLYEGQTCLMLEHEEVISAGISENYLVQISHPNGSVILTSPLGEQPKLVLNNINAQSTSAVYHMSADSSQWSGDSIDYELVLSLGSKEQTIQTKPYAFGKKGGDISLTCSYGEQWRDVLWMKGRHPVNATVIKNETGRYVTRGLALDILNLTSDDAGSYFCGVQPLRAEKSEDTKHALYGRTTVILGEVPQHLLEGFQFPKLNCNQTIDTEKLGTCTFSYLRTSEKHRTLMTYLYEGQSCIIPRHSDFANSGMANNWQISYLNHTVATKPAGSNNCDRHFGTTYGDSKQGVILNMTRSVEGVYKLSAATPSLADTDEADLVVYMVPKEATVQTSSYVTLNLGGETVLPFVYGKGKRRMQCKKGTDLHCNTTVDLVSLRFHDASGKLRNESGRFAITDSSVIIKDTIPSDKGMYFLGVDPLEGGGTLWSTTIVLNQDVVGDQIPEGTPAMSSDDQSTPEDDSTKPNDDQSTPEDDSTKPNAEKPCNKSTLDRKDEIIVLSCALGVCIIIILVLICYIIFRERKNGCLKMKIPWISVPVRYT